MREATNRVRQYEMMVILVPDLPEEDLPGAIDRVTGIVSDAKGTVTHINRDSPWGRRRLAYPIRHESRDVRDGFYVLFYFDADANAIVDIERDLRLYDSVMRHMITLQVQPPIMPEPAEAADAPEATADGEGGDATGAESGGDEATAETPAEDVVVSEEPAASESTDES